MTVRECYAEMDGDYDNALSVMGSEERMRRYLIRFADDQTAPVLFRALSYGENQQAFSAAHTLKGVCRCLGMTRLYVSSRELTEALRAGPCDTGLVRRVYSDYQAVLQAVHALGGER